MLRRREGIQKTVPIQDLGVVLSSVKTERHIHYTDSFREAQIIIELQGHVAEYHDSNPQDYMSFKSSLERQLESELEKIVLHTQTLSIDPFNMGMETKGWIRRPFNGEQWKKHWPEVRVSVKLLVKLDNIGTIYPSLTRGGERLMRREINNESSSLPHFGVAHDSNVIWMQHPN
jgi:spore germination protein